MEEIFKYKKWIQEEWRNILVRIGIGFFVLVALSFLQNFTIFMKYGYSRDGSLQHSFLDYPNEINSKDALELSKFMKALNTLWNSDQSIYQPMVYGEEEFYDDSPYGFVEVNVKDPIIRSSVIHQLAKKMGASTSNFPMPTSLEKHTLVQEPDVRLPRITAVKGAIASPPDYLKLKKPPRSFVPKCHSAHLSQKKSTVISFDPKQFTSSSIRVDGMFSYGGKIKLKRATAADRIKEHNNITVNITLSAQSEDFFNHISVSEVNLDNQSNKYIHINSHHPSLLKNCLVVDVAVTFPEKLQNYKDLMIKANRISRVEGTLAGLYFDKFTVGLGKGVIAMEELSGGNILLGAINGLVTGNYKATEAFGAAVLKGATIVDIEPQSKFLKSTVAALDGPVKAIVHGGQEKALYGCRFITHCWLCQPRATTTNSEHNIHIYSERRTSIKMGYYREWSTTHHINVHSKYGASKLIFS